MNTRLTLQKQIVLDTVREMHNHPTADEVYEKIKASFPSISRATVYRNLNALSESSEILKVMNPKGADRFDCFTDNHYHINCIRCGGVFDVKMNEIDLKDKIIDSCGFDIFHCNIFFSGVCPNCKTNF